MKPPARKQTHPGGGPLVGMAYVLTIGPAARFPRGKQVASYLGLIPREKSSGGRQRLGSISKQGNTMMRALLVEAAQNAVRGDDQLRRDYRRLAHKHAALAKVMVAQAGGAVVLDAAREAAVLDGKPHSGRKNAKRSPSA